jgi:hypothetical protein
MDDCEPPAGIQNGLPSNTLYYVLNLLIALTVLQPSGRINSPLFSSPMSPSPPHSPQLAHSVRMSIKSPWSPL